MAKKRKLKKKTIPNTQTISRETSAPKAEIVTRDKELLTDRVWLGCSAFIMAISAFLRFFWLELKPFHHDEGVNGFFLKNLINDGIYKYDPANYHGPTLYYISLAFAKVFGLDTIPVRFSMAIFGVLTVVLALFLRRYIGKTGSLAAALFLAISPGMVYISRYFIHEILFVFLSLAVVVAILFFIEKRSAGIFAVVWMALLLLVCFLPSGLNLAAYLGGENTGTLWALRIAFCIVEAVLAYLVIRMLLSWNEGRPIYLILASASVALMFATKETAFITLGTMLIACVCVWIWRAVRLSEFFEKNLFGLVAVVHVLFAAAALYYRQALIDGGTWMSGYFFSSSRPHEPFVFYSIVFLAAAALAAWVIFLLDRRWANNNELEEPVDITWQNFRRGLGQRLDLILITAGVVTAFIYISILFFSSFFTYAEGVKKAFEAYAIWTKTGNKDHAMHGYTGYLKWGMKVEGPVMILSALGALIALAKGKHRFAMFTGLWGLGLFAAYSIIPYKTPWNALSFLLPMCIIAGYSINELFTSKNIRLKVAAVALALSASTVLAYQTYQHNFVRYDDGEMTYVYAHTRRGFLDMMSEIERYCDKSGKGKDAVIEIVTPEYWPMTWYVRKYSHANFFGSLIDTSTSEMIVSKKNDQDTAVIQKYSANYKYVGVYPLRPGVNLVLLVRRDLADANTQELHKILEYKIVPGYTD